MNNSKKITIIIAVILVAVGLFISFGALFVMDFDFTGMNSMNFVTNTYSVDEEFINISVEGVECDVRLLPSNDDSCKIVCNESDKVFHSVTVKNNTLTIVRTDTRKWYEYIGIYWGKTEVAIYLPQTEYEFLYVVSVSGDIDIPDGFSFADAEVHSTSGNISFTAAVEKDLSARTLSGELNVSDISLKNLDVQSISGDITVTSVRSESELKIKTVSGNVKLTDMECQSAVAESTSGEVELSKVIASENIHIGSVSGNVELLECDADSLWIKTTSGNVFGTLLTEKVFITDTTSGNIDVPYSGTGGKCEIKTTSGNIKFQTE